MCLYMGVCIAREGGQIVESIYGSLPQKTVKITCMYIDQRNAKVKIFLSIYCNKYNNANKKILSRNIKILMNFLGL